jgi:hypothetical protein
MMGRGHRAVQGQHNSIWNSITTAPMAARNSEVPCRAGPSGRPLGLPGWDALAGSGIRSEWPTSTTQWFSVRSGVDHRAETALTNRACPTTGWGPPTTGRARRGRCPARATPGRQIAERSPGLLDAPSLRAVRGRFVVPDSSSIVTPTSAGPTMKAAPPGSAEVGTVTETANPPSASASADPRNLHILNPRHLLIEQWRRRRVGEDGAVLLDAGAVLAPLDKAGSGHGRPQSVEVDAFWTTLGLGTVSACQCSLKVVLLATA